jgi:hypothetical protein
LLLLLILYSSDGGDSAVLASNSRLFKIIFTHLSKMSGLKFKTKLQIDGAVVASTDKKIFQDNSIFSLILPKSKIKKTPTKDCGHVFQLCHR